jgi:hypothetical protein
MFETLIQETEKEIRMKLRTIKPTKEEVEKMEEYEWISCVAPLKYYKLGYETALKQCQTIAEKEKAELIEKIKDKLRTMGEVNEMGDVDSQMIYIGEIFEVLDTFKQAEKIE